MRRKINEISGVVHTTEPVEDLVPRNSIQTLPVRYIRSNTVNCATGCCRVTQGMGRLGPDVMNITIAMHASVPQKAVQACPRGNKP